MIYSMTGFGRSEGTADGRTVLVEIRSLNGKQLELFSKMPHAIRPYELDLRSTISTMLVRGSVDVAIQIKQEGVAKPMAINTELAKYYYNAMQQLAEGIGLAEKPSLDSLLKMPEVLAPTSESFLPEDWEQVKRIVTDAISMLTKHREVEGESLKVELLKRFLNIERLANKVSTLEEGRKQRLQAKMEAAFSNYGIDNVDANRYEQELIYYFEKMDFTEEKVRLQQHISYFRQSLEGDDAAKGKLLGFILQEVGREINTLGSKANDAAIQQLVVQMKDELEKAKEQVLNVL